VDFIPAPFDEFRDGTGAVRPHWRRFAELLTALPAADLERRKQSAAAAIRDNGVIYNVYDENDSDRRAGQFDIVPFLLPRAEWSEIAKGLIQRAELAEALLADIYGPQNLIRERVLPPPLVLGNPKFLRPLAVAAAKSFLHLFAVDLARAPDGSWHVLRSFADVPPGLGQVLENRLMASQSLPEAFGETGVARLRPFLRSYRDQVISQMTRRGRAVLLTPGPHHPAYFEHVFLAHYLGLTLVEGDDLAVREDALFLKSLTGLERVGALFRRVESDFCDPLELRGDSLLGVPNLVQVARSESAFFANGLGAAAVEAPGLEAFLPDLCRLLKGEDLRLPGLATFWCGDNREKIETDAPESMLRSAFDPDNVPPGSERRDELFVVQRPILPSLGVGFAGGFFREGALSLRMFAARAVEGWTIMPGGLVQVRAGERVLTRDCWIAGAAGAEPAPGQTAPDIKRRGESAPSRALDSLFWLGRYAERSESLVRILRAITLRLGENPSAACDLMARLAIPFSPREEDDPALSADEGERALAEELERLVFRRTRQRGLPRLLAQLEEAAWSVRDRLSLDTWRAVHAMTARPPATQVGLFDAAGAAAYLDSLVRRSAALAGLAGENMTRGPNWLFLELGRRIERASHLAWVVRQSFGDAGEGENERMRALLEIADSSMTYRSRYLNRFALAPILDLSLLDATNPRSAAFQLAAIRRHLTELPRVTKVQRAFLADRIAGELETQIAAAQPEWLAEAAGAKRHTLSELCRQLQSGAADLSDALADAYFQHASRHRTGAAARIGIA
jgi:uncharacterized circularly permuted ATP-grasp superfamily protein/uncharacterized alpha-E superfamily protein